MNTKYKHIYFRDMSQYYPKRKTSTWLCINHSEVKLGTVQWNSGWRQYIFIPDQTSELMFSASCLDDIGHFIKQLMSQRITDKKQIERISKIKGNQR